MKTSRRRRVAALVAVALPFAIAGATTGEAGINLPEYVGPTPYTSSADSPFDTDAYGYCIEDFENGKFDVPEATINGTIAGPGGNTDSVDADDGEIDGSGTNGRSWFSGNGAAGITIEFDPERANGLPTLVGVVWTDSGAGASVTFEAFDVNDESVLLAPYGPFLHSDASNNGETDEDRFYGVISGAGVRKIHISNTSGGIEIDHVQLNRCFLCGDANADLQLSASDALFVLRASVGTEECMPCICDANDSDSLTVADALAVLRRSVGITAPADCPSCPPQV